MIFSNLVKLSLLLLVNLVISLDRGSFLLCKKADAIEITMAVGRTEMKGLCRIRMKFLVSSEEMAGSHVAVDGKKWSPEEIEGDGGGGGGGEGFKLEALSSPRKE